MNDMITDALNEHNGIAVYALFSGGHDSLTATHIAAQHPAFRGVIHIDTGTGLRETRQFVEETCRAHGWPLHTKRPFMPYEAYLIKFGFPGPAMHGMMYDRLKDRPLRALLKDIGQGLNIGQGERIGLVSGVRKQESDRRANIQDTAHTEGRRIWIPIIADYSAGDCRDYIRDNGLKRSPVKDKIHMSGECFCGAFARNGEYQEIEFWFPHQAERICRWQELVTLARENQQWEVEGGFRDEIGIEKKHCQWGHGADVPHEQMTFPMCYFCRDAT